MKRGRSPATPSGSIPESPTKKIKAGKKETSSSANNKSNASSSKDAKSVTMMTGNDLFSNQDLSFSAVSHSNKRELSVQDAASGGVMFSGGMRVGSPISRDSKIGAKNLNLNTGRQQK